MATEKLAPKAGRLNMVIEQGASFTPVLTWKDENGTPIDLTGFTARMHIRADVTDATTLLELTTENNRIVLGTVDGTIGLVLTDAETAALTWESGVYDLELVSSGGYVTRLLRGTVTVQAEVTRPDPAP